MIAGDLTGASRERTLDSYCALAAALLELADLDASHDTASSERHRRDATRFLEESTLPTAVFAIASRAPRVINRAWRALFGSRDAYEVIPHIDATARARTTLHHPELALELDGRPAYVAATLRVSCNEHDKATHVIVACVDITDEIAARELAVGAEALVWGGPLGGEATYFNQRWLDYAGRTASWLDALHPDDAARCVETLAAAVRERGARDVEARLRGAAGELRWHRLRLAIAGNRTRWAGVAIDIHGARGVAEELGELLARERATRIDAERANRAKDAFLASVSHELRTPLTTIVLWEAVLRDERADPTLRARALEAIHQSVLVQSRIVGDMLDISRANSGKLYVDLRRVEVEQVVSAAVEAIVPRALEKGITVERRGSRITDHVQGDSVRLRQVLDNLLTNAVKFTERDGQITVTARRHERSIVVEVTDTGRGITADFLPRIFEPFSQTDALVPRADEGLGLGLAIAKRIVELHGGTLAASSPGLGHGATLKMSLPVGAATSAPAALDRRAVALGGTRILVIDDDRRVREALAVLLDRAGADVDVAESAEAGRAKIAQRPPDAVICDIAMPVEDGYTFISRLRATGSDVVAIAVTAHVTEADVDRALAAGFDRHVGKPIDLERLVANIDELVRKRADISSTR